MEPIANAQQSANMPQPPNMQQSDSLEQPVINLHVSFCLSLVSDEVTAISSIEYIEKHKLDGAVHLEYLAHLNRYSKERVEYCEKTLAALGRARELSVREGILRPDQKATQIAVLVDCFENNLKLWKKLQGLVEA
ncbi:hypothetical protein LZ32DRAFT_678260 [Colletotrichum eremochloae]|nr:hypothetical protein LZ32DRAFT_678260 [Colletotrichum eremochloae]